MLLGSLYALKYILMFYFLFVTCSRSFAAVLAKCTAGILPQAFHFEVADHEFEAALRLKRFRGLPEE